MITGRSPEVLDLAVAVIDTMTVLRKELLEALGVDKSIGETVFSMSKTKEPGVIEIAPGVYWHPIKGTQAKQKEVPPKVLAWIQEYHPEIQVV